MTDTVPPELIACWRIKARRGASEVTARGDAGPASVAKRMPTATKLSQKPGCSRAQGSRRHTQAAASPQVYGQGHRSPARRSTPLPSLVRRPLPVMSLRQLSRALKPPRLASIVTLTSPLKAP